jgi:hypothetical protein
MTGVQGIGVSTPRAAEVAEATAGFASELHMPKGGMFTNGMLSMIVAAGRLLVRQRFSGSTTSALGATPKLHIRLAPLQTWRLMGLLGQVHGE